MLSLAFVNVGECAGMAAQFVDYLLDPVDHWLVLWLSKYLGQCFYWPERVFVVVLFYQTKFDWQCSENSQ